MADKATDAPLIDLVNTSHIGRSPGPAPATHVA